MTAITAGTLKSEVLDPAMDARALNIEQERLIFDPSPEVDSLLEHVNAICAGEPGRCADLLDLLTRFVRSNQQEASMELRVIGFADNEVRRTRGQELNARLAPLSGRRLAGLLREPLAIIVSASEHDALAFVRAVRTVDELVARVPRAQLLAETVAHHLAAPRRFELLTGIVAAFYEREPGADDSGPASSDQRVVARDLPES